MAVKTFMECDLVMAFTMTGCSIRLIVEMVAYNVCFRSIVGGVFTENIEKY